jgi:hypothetical protein
MHVLRTASFRSIATIALLFPAFAACSKDASKATATDDGGTTTGLAPLPTVPANGTPIPTASIEAVVNPAKLPPYNGPTGSVEGTISITGDPSPVVPDQDFHVCPTAEKTYGKLFREGAPTPGGRALADAIVAITGYSDFYLPERSDVRSITVDDCAFPRVIDMTVGQRLEVLNKTNQIWAPALEQAGLPALMVETPGSDAVKLYPPRPGHFNLIDKLSHLYARSDLWVLMQPLHAVSGIDGHYRIDGVPVGTLKVGARLSAIGKDASKSVDVLAGVVQKVDLTITYAAVKDAGAPAVTRIDAGTRPLIK